MSGTFAQAPGGQTFPATGRVDYATGAWSIVLPEVFLGPAQISCSYIVRKAIRPLMANDFDGDRRSDLGYYRSTDGLWMIKNSNGGETTEYFGYHRTRAFSGDFDGDGKSDFGCYDADGIPTIASPGSWYLLQSTRGFRNLTFGYRGTVPVVGDFDGDGISDFGCYDAAGIPGIAGHGSWYLLQSTRGFRSFMFGYRGTVPVVGDFDGDGKSDFGCYDATGIPGIVPPGSWYLMQSTRGFRSFTFGYRGTVPVIGDFDGDGKSDVGCYDAAGIPGMVAPGSWYFLQSTRGFRNLTFGYRGTVPVVGDFDGDGKSDICVYDANGNASSVNPGTWFIMQTKDGFRRETWGDRGTTPFGH